jgi:nucleoside-diphosphate-sugar epimerase
VLTQFLHNILYGSPIKLVDGGTQRRSFTYISDGIDCLMKILENRGGAADGGIFNIGNPANDLSVRQLAEALVEAVAAHPGFGPKARQTPIVEVSSGEYYGSGYQDTQHRVPKIDNTMNELGWQPQVAMDAALRGIFEAYRGDVAEARKLMD